MKIEANQLLKLCSKADDRIVQAIVDHAETEFAFYRINTPLRIQHFFAHVAVESGYLRKVEENMSYSAKRLMQVWPKRFPTLAVANKYASNPQALANFVYGGRLGNVEANDGWLYRGRGLLQTTGRYNVGNLAKHLGVTIDEARDMLASDDGMMKCACATFVYEGALPFADKDDIVGSTKAINGGTHGLKERTDMLRLCKKIFV